MPALSDSDLRRIATLLPRDVAELLKVDARRLFLAGGFVRACVAGEDFTDVDLFGYSLQQLDDASSFLAARRTRDSDRCRKHKTANAITLITPNRLTVQFITRWTYETPEACIASFDFTVCQAVVWRTPDGSWHSLCSERFYQDLAGRQLVYANPVRDEEAGGSLMRVIKYVRRGYRIQAQSLGMVVARLVAGIKPGKEEALVRDPTACGYVLAGLIREVDPALVVDGMDAVEDGAPIDGFDAPEFPETATGLPIVPPPGDAIPS